jgi:hypothetical protein
MMNVLRLFDLICLIISLINFFISIAGRNIPAICGWFVACIAYGRILTMEDY